MPSVIAGRMSGRVIRYRTNGTDGSMSDAAEVPESMRSRPAVPHYSEGAHLRAAICHVRKTYGELPATDISFPIST